jgi:TatD DNase family protein
MLIDTHCHLNFPQYDSDKTSVIGNAKKARVKKFIVPGVNYISSKIAVGMTGKYSPALSAAVGLHPYESESNPDIHEIEKLINQNVVAIGECGLDYHLYKNEAATGKKDRQKKLFTEHLILANKYNLPIIMHCRDAFMDFFDVIDNIPQIPYGVLHCFDGGMSDLREAQKRKFFVGIDGNVTFSKQLGMIVPQIPLSMLVLESDSPNLTPTPFRGQRNEPKHLIFTAKKIAELTHKSLSEIADITTANAIKLFKLN